MGITGLLPFLRKSSRETNIKEFKGCTVAIDSYCWLHKGAFSCADKLALGEKTEQYVYYCMKYVNSLLSFGLKPILVFDGARLPSKEGVERERKERREIYRKKAAQLLREGRRGEARECLQRCIDITPNMALELMNACRAKGVDCIVAPYEADSQLAYLCKTGIAQVIISEDSDLILFGCKKVMYKMDFAGNGVMVETENLARAMDLKADVFTFDKFRYMCILSGCDYLPSLPGIGLGKANKVFKLTRQTDINMVLRKLPTTLKMPQLGVTKEYIDGFHRANNTFLYQLCFDPRTRRQVPLVAYPDTVDPRELEYAGPYMSEERSLQMAYGNLNHYNGEKIANFDPDSSQTVRRGGLGTPSHLLSIWDPHYRPMKLTAPVRGATMAGRQVAQVSTRGREVIVTSILPRPSQPTPKRPFESEDPEVLLNLVGLYDDGAVSQQSKRVRCEWDEEGEDEGTTAVLNQPTPPTSPLREIHSNCETESPLDTTSVLEPDPSPKPEPHTPKVSRNKFACHRISAKEDRFDLNVGRPDVKSRFFTANSKPLPQTDFFHSLTESAPSMWTVKAEAPSTHSAQAVKADQIAADDKVNSGGERLQSTPSAGTGVHTAKDSRRRTGGDATVCSPHGSFGFGKKLQMFKSTFDKVGAHGAKSSAVSSSPLSRGQFKPVLTAGSGKENDAATASHCAAERVDVDADVAELAGGAPLLTQPPCLGITTMPATPQQGDGKLSGYFPDTEKTTPKAEQQVVPRLPTLSFDSSPCAAVTPRGGGCRTVGLSKSSSKLTGKAATSNKQASISSFFSQFTNKKKCASSNSG